MAHSLHLHPNPGDIECFEFVLYFLSPIVTKLPRKLHQERVFFNHVDMYPHVSIVSTTKLQFYNFVTRVF